MSLRFTLSNTAAEEGRSDVPPGLIPAHKQSVVLFLERVYGMDDKDLFFSLLEDAFLPDLRAATSLNKVCTVGGVSTLWGYLWGGIGKFLWVVDSGD